MRCCSPSLELLDIETNCGGNIYHLSALWLQTQWPDQQVLSASMHKSDMSGCCYAATTSGHSYLQALYCCGFTTIIQPHYQDIDL